MASSLTRKLIDSCLVGGEAVAGEEIGQRVDQTLTQDATGTQVMQEQRGLRPTYTQRSGVPGKTMVGSHTCAAGSLGNLGGRQ
jgi:homoaconitase/3-isopropylmalate dehydratase large subunit